MSGATGVAATACGCSAPTPSTPAVAVSAAPAVMTAVVLAWRNEPNSIISPRMWSPGCPALIRAQAS
jgi:hypothetical protein